jgi:hypothetical protein
VPLKIVADGQPPRDEDGAIVLLSTAQTTAVQFGDEATVAYLKRARQVSVRYAIGGVTVTETFEGGKPMDDVIDKALKACGRSYQTKEDAQANDALVAANQTADWYYKDGNEDAAECHAMSGTPKQFADAAVGKGATNIETKGSSIGADVLISYGLKDTSYSYYFYKSHEKCANPFSDLDNTQSDFGRISHDVDADQDKADQTLADEALKHATDKGPWWLSDGTR